MANTYVLIASNTLGSSAASVTFSSIPSTYTDLVLKVSTRTDQSGSFGGGGYVRFNSDSATNYSITDVYGDGSTAASARRTSVTFGWWSYEGYNTSGSTANTFTNAELYIPSYQASANKPYSAFSAAETNATTAIIQGVAGLWRNTAAITSILISPDAGNFVSGSSFFLYGIKSS